MSCRFTYLGTYANSTGFYMCVAGRPGISDSADVPTTQQVSALAEYYSDVTHDGLVLIYRGDTGYTYRLIGDVPIPLHTIVPMLKVLLEISDYSTSSGVLCTGTQATPYYHHDTGLTRCNFLAIFADLADTIPENAQT